MIRKILFGLFIITFFIIHCAEKEIGGVFKQLILIAPEDGSTLTQNPPTFVWHSVDNSDIVYVLEVAAAEQFDSASIVISTTIMPPDTSYTINDPLPSGEYHWRMCLMHC